MVGRLTSDVGALLDGQGRGEHAAAPQELQTPVVQLGREAEADPLQSVREQGVRDGREHGLGQLTVVTHALQQDLLVVGAQPVPQPLVGGEVPGYERQANIFQSFHL